MEIKYLIGFLRNRIVVLQVGQLCLFNILKINKDSNGTRQPLKSHVKLGEVFKRAILLFIMVCARVSKRNNEHANSNFQI